jgi:glycosyltransferase involved in cell wall biosynthesis
MKDTNVAETVHTSIIVPVGGRQADIAALYADYKAGAALLQQPHEFIFVLDGPRPEAAAALRRLVEQGEAITVVGLSRSFGEATALQAGFEQARGDVIVTLPAYFQVKGSEIQKLTAALDAADLVVGHRSPRAGGPLEKLRRGAFHGLLAMVTKVRFRDLGCGARAMRRRVLEEIALYGDQHRFLAVLADRQGFRVRELDVAQAPQDRFKGFYGPREYARSLLDIFSIFFLARFTKRPLRFFGMIGVVTFGIGAVLVAILVAQKLFFAQGLAGRPALLLSSLMVVLGMQIFALGLLGELIIFTHARDIKDYQVDRVVHYGGDRRSG